GFWSPRIERWRATTIGDVFDKFEKYGGFRNFDRVAAGEKGGHRGEPWWDGLIYESIRGASDFLAAHPDPDLEKRIAGFVDRIDAAADKDPDGYVNTAQTLEGIGIRWSNPPAEGDDYDNRFPHTVYNAGCLVEAGVHHYKATGDTKLLRVATRLANYMTGIMGPPPKQNIIPGHAVGEESFAELYRLYRDEPGLKGKIGLEVDENAYLDLARFWIENRGNTEGRASEGAYNQDDVSVFQQPTLQGHAVRSALLAAGLATVGAENGRDDYRETAARWWRNMADARMYLTGGLGAVAAHEGFGADHELPNDGYAETCAAVAGGFFSRNMNLLTGDAEYVDVLERVLYNGALSGVALTGDAYFYENPLTATTGHRRWHWRGDELGSTPCCPPMFLKLMGALPGCIYATRGGDVFVNLYLGSRARVGGMRISQETKYPWGGMVELVVSPETTTDFALHLRVPDWVEKPEVAVNGSTVANPRVADHYLVLDRRWAPGDKVTLRLPMPVRRVKADPRVEANIGRVALMRGPVVYCFEGVDNHDATKSILLKSGDPLATRYDPNLLGGVVAIDGKARIVRNESGRAVEEPAAIRAIPFFANANREPTTMDVWIADDMAAVIPAPDGRSSASHCFSSDTVVALNDGIVPKSS
ncbi:MAG: glycoside hydrolase family 127 protein, partial [Verrucomicrobiae bacterium]|nr:glycoside hydrolase family 127 protein [Verrucomicrobiae bacterium]